MNKKTLIALIAFLLVVGIAVGVYFLTRSDTESAGRKKRANTPDGKITVTLIVVHGDKTVKKWTVKTEAEYLEQVLLDEGILKKEDDENGLYSTFDGETADWNKDQSWWQLFEGDVSAVRGVREIPLTDGGVYRMEYTVGGF